MVNSEEWASGSFHFRRKLNDVRAIRVTTDNVRDVAKWCGGEELKTPSAMGERYVAQPLHPILNIPTLTEFPLQAYHGNWVVKGEDGKFSIMENKIFVEEYEVNPDRNPTISFPEGVR